MAEEDPLPLFIGDREQLRSLARWLDQLERAVIERTTDGFAVDIRALNTVLARGYESLGGLNPIEADKVRELISKMNADAASILASGLQGFIDPTPELLRLHERNHKALLEASPYSRWLGVKVRDRLDRDAAGEPSEAAGDASTPTKTKRSTERGEGRAKLIAALTKHHKYADGGCLNLEPIGNNELARLAGVSESTASAFFNKQFVGHTKYRAICADVARIVAALKLLNQEFAPHHLFGAKPPGEGEREDDE